MLLGAAVCATAAALLTRSMLAGHSDQPVVVVAAPVETAVTRVVVATAPLKFGTVLSAEHLVEVPWPNASIPADAFTSKQALVGNGQRVVLSAIAKDEPILAAKVSGPGQRPSLSIMIEEGKKAVTIRVDDVLGVAGFVQPGDHVDVLLTRSERGIANGAASINSAFTDLLLQSVRVLAIDQLADRNTQAKPVKAVTVEVETAEAQKLVLAASIGQLSLALRRAGGLETSAARRIGLQDLPYSRPAAEPAAPVTMAAEPERGPLVTVIRGANERKQYDLAPDASRPPIDLTGDSALRAAQAKQILGEEGKAAQPR
jgi:pilus assembly protein CpaB